MIALILAGGLGTRLRDAVPDLPKPMAPVAGKPFLEYVLADLSRKGVEEAILSVGFKSDKIIETFPDKYLNLSIKYSWEKEPLGTGGAIAFAMNIYPELRDEPFLLANGDTFFDVDLEELFELNTSRGADIAVALKPMKNFDRYGAVKVGSEDRVLEFREKAPVSVGLINGGVYAIDPKIFDKFDLPEKFSFEKDVLEPGCEKLKIFGKAFDSYFIDIGVPEDYRRANENPPDVF